MAKIAQPSAHRFGSSSNSTCIPCEVCRAMVDFDKYVEHLEIFHKYPKVVGDSTPVESLSTASSTMPMHDAPSVIQHPAQASLHVSATSADTTSCRSDMIPCEVCGTLCRFEDYDMHLSSVHGHTLFPGSLKREHDSTVEPDAKRPCAIGGSSSSSSSSGPDLLAPSNFIGSDRDRDNAGFNDEGLGIGIDIPAPLPAPREQMLPGTTWFVSPLEIRFTHDKINERFRPFMKSGQRIVHKSILDSVEDCLRPRDVPSELELVDVVWHRDHLYVAGSFNRRLCMYRLLAIFAGDRFGLIQVQVLDRDEPRVKFFKKLTTRCAGQSIEIRHGRFVGMQRDDVKWPEAIDLFRKYNLCGLESDSIRSCLPWIEGQASQPTHDSKTGQRVGFCSTKESIHRFLRDVIGWWRDSDGSKYHVTIGTQGTSSLTVRTVRSNGDERTTERLIRISRLDTGGFRIAWSHSFVLGRFLSDGKGRLMSIEWIPQDERGKVYVWVRE